MDLSERERAVGELLEDTQARASRLAGELASVRIELSDSRAEYEVLS